MVHRNSLRLQKLVNTLLDFSRIEAGRMQAIYEPVDLARLTIELASTFRSAVERAGMRSVVDCEALERAGRMSTAICGKKSSSTCCRTPSNSRSKEKLRWR